MAASLQTIKARDDVVMVDMDEVELVTWSARCQFLATEALNGCTGETTGDEHLRILMQKVINSFNTGRQRGIFQASNSIVLAANYQGTTALPDAISVIKAILERLKLPIRYVEYPVLTVGDPRSPGETSIMIRGQQGQQPQIYINDKLLTAEEKTDTPARTADSGSTKGSQDGQNTAIAIQKARQEIDRYIAAGWTRDQAMAEHQKWLAQTLRISEIEAQRLLAQDKTHGDRLSAVASSSSGVAVQAQQAQAAYLRLQQQGMERTTILQQLILNYQATQPDLSWDKASKHVSSLLSYTASRAS
ncbi:hypothetical protein Slin15195_G076920 [Septoria linicola]|uniref:Uncharacterized protein n=1 Tax=Septoria linicola TaxID=215465 RepID=A0A9Q9AYH3_9PEZI|nr:hypothetical protein Slin14017_G038090 [Septoria linicola]USW54373.1 hypothetical protein Slin15195_G076920 [Septoria linicola]